jgi:hypothetical protein
LCFPPPRGGYIFVEALMNFSEAGGRRLQAI